MCELIIVGLGPGSPGLITLETWDLLAGADRLLLRTARHPSVALLSSRGLAFNSYDQVYDALPAFEDVYQHIATDCLEQTRNAGGQKVVYAVPGSPMVAEKTVELIRAQAGQYGVQIKIAPGMSFLEVLYTKLGIDPINGLTVLDSADLLQLPAPLATGLVVTQVYSRQVASEAKLSLMELYGDEYPVTVVRNLGLIDEEICNISLFELDRLSVIDHLTSVYVAPQPPVQRFELAPVLDVMKRLRSPGGCIWDIEQTHQSLRRYFIEEVYEVLEAIDLKDSQKLCEELGDVLLQVVFHARVAEEYGDFSMQDVIDGIADKLIRRHPHVFGDIMVEDAAQVLFQWDEIKSRERSHADRTVLDGIPPALPTLMKTYKLQAKAAKVGFDWDNIDDVWRKLKEEINELKAAVQGDDRQSIENELGDVLFSAVNLARFLDVDAEVALVGANRKFKRRFAYIETAVREQGLVWSAMTLPDLDKLWTEAKLLEK